MRVHVIGLALAGSLCACSPAAPTDLPTAADVGVLPLSDACKQSEERRKHALSLVQHGRLDRTVRVLQEADRLCPSLARNSWATLLTTLGELGRYEEMRVLLSEIAKDAAAPEDARQAASRWKNLEQKPVDPFQLMDAALGEVSPAQRRRHLDRALTALENQSGRKPALDARNGFWKGVTAIAWHEDRLAVVASAIHILDPKTFDVLFEIPRSPGRIDHVRFLADGRHLLAGSHEGSVLLWDLAGRKLRLATPRREDIHVTRLVGQGASNRMETVRMDEGGPRWSPVDFDPQNYSADELQNEAAVSRDHALLALRRDHDIDVYRIGERDKLFTLRSTEGRNGVTDLLAFSPDTTRLAAIAGDFDITVFDLKRRVPVRRLNHDGTVLTFAFSSDGRRLASGAYDQTLRVWDVEQGTKVLGASHGQEVVAVAFSPDGRRVASGSPNGELQVWDINTKREVHRRAPHVPRVDALAFAPDGSLITGTSDGAIRIWGRQLVTLRDAGYVRQAKLTPNGTVVATTIHNGLQVWNVADRRSVKSLPERSQFVVASAIDSSFRTAFFGDVDGTLAKVDIATSQELWSRNVGAAIHSVAVSHGGATLAVGLGSKDIHLVDARTGVFQRALTGHSWMVNEVIFTPDDRHVVSHGGDVHVFEVGTGKSVLREKGETIAVAPDGTHVLIADGAMVRLVELQSGRQVRRYDLTPSQPNSLAFSPDGTVFAAATWHRDCGIWSVTTGERLVTIEAVEALDAGFLRTPDGQIERVGSEREQARKYLACRFGELVVPFEVCEDRLSVEGVFGDLARKAGSPAGR